ncbi:MAG TPA: hypothetical protein DCE78_08865 [Bacteroidetes bacterium]|nr:hypothetical protein [Bacteroidota bacterium]
MSASAERQYCIYRDAIKHLPEEYDPARCVFFEKASREIRENSEFIIFAKKAIEDEEMKRGRTFTYWMMNGHMEYRAGRDPTPYYLVAQKMLQEKQIRAAHFNYFVNSWRSLELFQNFELEKNDFSTKLNTDTWEKVEFSLKDPVSIDFTVLVGCDSIYAIKYLKLLIHSVNKAKLEFRLLVRVYILNPTQDVNVFMVELKDYVDKLEKIFLDIIFIKSDDINVDKALLTSMRFLYLPQSLKKTSVPTIVVDIDSYFESSIFSCLSQLQKKIDVGIMGYEGHLNHQLDQPWRTAAGAVFVNANINGETYSKCVKHYIENVYSTDVDYQNRNLNWGIDQVALSRSIDYLKNDTIKFGDLKIGPHIDFARSDKELFLEKYGFK